MTTEPKMKDMNLSFGLTTDEMDLRAGSIGASETRIIVNGNDEELDRLWRLKTGQLDLDDLNAEMQTAIYPQFGHFVEAFHANFLEYFMGVEVIRQQEHVTSSDYDGMHVTLDGVIDEVEPHTPPTHGGTFQMHWGCDKPKAPFQAILEMKWRNARQYSAEGQAANFMPQLQQAMALTGIKHAILSTFTSDLVMAPHVIPFDQFYWAECMVRIEAFLNAVEKEVPPEKFPKINAPESVAVKKTIFQPCDLTTLKGANMIGIWAQALIESTPTEDEKQRASTHKKAKDELKKLIPADASPVSGFGMEGKRAKNGALTLKGTAEAIEAAHRASGLLAETGQAE